MMIICLIKPKIGVILSIIGKVKLVEMSNEFSIWVMKCFVMILKRSNQPKVVSIEELTYKSSFSVSSSKCSKSKDGLRNSN